MRSVFLALAALCVVSAAEAQGGPHAVVPYVGYDYSTEHPLIGAGLRLALPVPGRIALHPSVEGQLTGDAFVSRRLQGSLDLVAEFPAGVVTPYVGAGLAVLSRYTEAFGRDGGVGGNVFAGVLLGRTAGPRPFAQVRYTALDLLEDSAVSLTGGVVIGL